MVNVITVKVSKGGVGKTTISSNLAQIFSEKNKKTLIIDLDSQSNLSKIFIQEIDENIGTSSNLLGDDNIKIEELIYKINNNLDIIVSDIGLGEVAKYLESSGKYFSRLKNLIDIGFFNKYDTIILDLSPGVADSITEIAIAASDLLLCPMHLDIDSLSGLILTIEDMSRLHENNIVEKDLKYLVVPNRYDLRFKKDNEIILGMLYENLEKEFISKPIRENSHIKKARMYGKTAIEYERDPKRKYEHKKAIEDFEKLYDKVQEILLS